MLSIGTSNGQQTVYELGELPRLYIIKNHPSSQQTVKNFQSRKRAIEQFYRSNFLGARRDDYNLNTIKLRTKDDSVVAKYLRDALRLGPSHYEQSIEFIEKAKSLDPGYYEVHRIEAIVQRANGNFPAAVECYEMAIECEPSSAPLRYWYAGFLMRDADDIEGALRQFEVAYECDSTSAPILLERARCMMFDGQFDEADGVLSPIITRSDLVPLMLRKTSDLSLQIALRRAESDITDQEKIIALNDLFSRFLLMPKANIDQKCNETLFKAAAMANKLIKSCSESVSEDVIGSLEKQVKQFNSQLEDAVQQDINVSGPRRDNLPSPDDINCWKSGIIKNYNDIRKFGFIIYDDYKNIFFHHSSIPSLPGVITPGEKVSFFVECTNDKYFATGLKLEGGEMNAGESGSGFVKSVVREKGFGFLFADGGKEMFFHKTACVSSFEKLEPGDKVSFTEGRNNQGECAENVQLIE